MARRKAITTILEDGVDLTAMQRAFCEAYVTDPSNAAAAARKAGATPEHSDVTASKWLSLDKVQGYIAELRKRAVEREPQAVADLSEALAGATTVLRTELKDYAVTTPANGRDYRGAMKAAEVLVKHYDALETAKDGATQVITVNVLALLDRINSADIERLRAEVLALPETVEAG